MEHLVPGDDRGWVKVVGADGTVKTLAGEYWGEEQLAWSPDGSRVYFSASESGNESYQVMSVNVSGSPEVRQAFSGPGGMLDQRHQRRRTAAGDAPRPALADAWRCSLARRRTRSGLAGFRHHRRRLAGPQVDGLHRHFCPRRFELRHLVARPRHRQGGSPWRRRQLWFLGRRTLGGRPVPTTLEIQLYPVGAGQTIRVPRGSLEAYTGDLPQWFAKSPRLLVCGNEKGKGTRCYAQDITDGALTPLTPEGVARALIAPDERTLLTRSANGTYEVRSEHE